MPIVPTLWNFKKNSIQLRSYLSWLLSRFCRIIWTWYYWYSYTNSDVNNLQTVDNKINSNTSLNFSKVRMASLITISNLLSNLSNTKLPINPSLCVSKNLELISRSSQLTVYIAVYMLCICCAVFWLWSAVYCVDTVMTHGTLQP